MSTRAWFAVSIITLLTPLAAGAAGAPTASASLTAEQVVAKNIAARGGLQAWRKVQALSFSGKMDAGGKQNARLPFVLELKRPRKSRVEIEFAHDRAIQVYDGANGWKVRPFLGRKEVEPFNADELSAASMESDLDGPLVDHALKGTTVSLEGREKVEGADTYRLKLTAKSGQARRLWIDAKTFLETKIDGVPRRLDGKMRAVQVYYRDFRPVDGLMIPHVLESVVEGTHQTHKILIDTVAVNPAVADSRFTKPLVDAIPGT